MEPSARASIPYREGTIVLTESHLLLLRGDGNVAESFALVHVSDASFEEWHSFRHRFLGIVLALALLTGSLLVLAYVVLEGGLAALFVLDGRLVLAVAVGLVVGMMFLVGVLTSRRIYWLKFRFGKTPRLIPLPDAAVEDIEKLVDLLNQGDARSE